MHPLSRIRLAYSGIADAHFSVVKLIDEKGAVIAETTQEKASREMTLPAPALKPGPYQLRYRVLSVDGDVVEGKVEFEVRAAAAPAPESARPES
jgi:copper resistance protein C